MSHNMQASLIGNVCDESAGLKLFHGDATIDIAADCELGTMACKHLRLGGKPGMELETSYSDDMVESILQYKKERSGRFGGQARWNRARRGRGGGSTMNIKIKRIRPLRVAFMRRIEHELVASGTENRQLPFPGKAELLDGNTKFVGLCHGDPKATLSGDVRYDACVTVDKSFRGDAEIAVQTVPGGDYAVIRHVGPYASLPKAYRALLREWLPESGRALAGTPCFEVYHNSPYSAAPEELVTDIYVPLREVAAPAAGVAPKSRAPRLRHRYELQSA
jgi:DNA gyrase inhibitor GyrI